MAEQTKRIFYLNRVAHPVYLELLGERADISVAKLEDNSPAPTVAEVVRQAHLYQIGSARGEMRPEFFADTDLLSRAPNLLVVSTSGAGYDTVNLAACTEAGVLAVNQSGGNREAVAEHVLGMMLTLSKRIVETDHYMRRTDGISRNEYMGHDLFGKTVGIVGLGNVGSRVAELSRGLFQMTTLAYDPYLSAEVIKERGAQKVELDELLRRADFLSINCPLTEETRGMIGARQFALMQPHAYFINTARGGIHDEDALAEALSARKLAGAGLDVWEQEPPLSAHRLMSFDNVTVSPHTAGVTLEARINIARIAAEQVIDIFDGKRPPRLLNPQVWPAYCKRFEQAFGFRPHD